jgi:hypothetical protein
MRRCTGEAWPSQALEKRPPLTLFASQAKDVRMAPRSQALDHLQPTKQAHLGSKEIGQGLATQPNTLIVI